MALEHQAFLNMLQEIPKQLGAHMAENSSFRIGGPADLLLPTTEAEILFCLNAAKEAEIFLPVIGRASNLLISDLGISEPVLCFRDNFSGIEHLGEGRFRVKAGTLLSTLAYESLKLGYQGLEWGAGIPGSLGGAAAMNAGAYGGEMSQILESVRYVDLDTLEIREDKVEKGDLGYRFSRFSYPSCLVLSVELCFSPDDGGARERMQDYAQRRREKQPLRYPSAGSTFKRPEGHFAGALIEQAGLKGFHIGDAEVSELHAGFVINRGNAKSREVKELIRSVQEKVFERFGVILEPEVRFVGKEED